MLVLRDRAFKFVSFGTNLHRLTNWVHYQHYLDVTGSAHRSALLTLFQRLDP